MQLQLFTITTPSFFATPQRTLDLLRHTGCLLRNQGSYGARQNCLTELISVEQRRMCLGYNDVALCCSQLGFGSSSGYIHNRAKQYVR